MTKILPHFVSLLVSTFSVALYFASIAHGDSITFYEDEYYRGRSFRVDGAGEISNLRTKDLGLNDNFNDEISSIAIDGNFSLTLYENNDFQGASVTINLSRPYLTYLSFSDWEDRVSSIKWTPLSPSSEKSVAIFYDQPNFRGNSFTISGDGDVYKLADKRRGSSRRNWNDQIRSIKIFGGNTLVVLYRDSKYRGATTSFNQSVTNLGGFSAVASSVKVFD